MTAKDRLPFSLRLSRPLALLASLALSSPLVAATDGDEPGLREAARHTTGARYSIGDVPWNARAVEHLFHRAAFGIAPRDIAAVVERPPAEVVDQLLGGGASVEPFPAQRYGADQYRKMQELSPAEQNRLKARIRADDQNQLRDYAAWWSRHMLAGVDPLRDRMALFWHGFFTTNARELRRNYEVVRQNQFLRDHALENYADLLGGIVRDAAMLHYLDNASNRAGSPNENLARELMELFSLGEGNYSEEDVREVARALTGYAGDRDGDFSFSARFHDGGTKRILGQEGEFNGDDVVRILLEQDACGEWVAGRIIEHLEGQPPSTDRLRKYAQLLRAEEYRLRPFLRALLLDPDFYRDEVVGSRVLAPVEFVVSTAVRLGLHPPPEFVYEAASVLGQRLFEPPNVNGWEEGLAWITSGSLLHRGNVAGLMLGVLDLDGAFEGGRVMGGGGGGMMDAGMRASPRMEPAMMDSMSSMTMSSSDDAAGSAVPHSLRTLRRALGSDYRPMINLTWRMRQAGALGDEGTVDRMLDELLAIEPPPGVRGPLIRFVRVEREAFDLNKGLLLDHPELSEPLLRRLAHLILSLPEAQLD